MEVTSEGIRLLIGYELNGKVCVLYTRELVVPDVVKDGVIVNEEGLIAALSSLHRFEHPDYHVTINISNVTIVIPSIGFNAFTDTKTSNTVGAEITTVDASNLVSMFTKIPLAKDQAIVDIIPIEYSLDDGDRYAEPPFGKSSKMLTMKGYVHVIPESIKSSYTNAFLRAGYRVTRVCCASYCQALALDDCSNMPKQCLVVECGAEISSVNLVGNRNSLLCNTTFGGSNRFTEDIMKEFGIPHEAAETLKVHYGYDTRKRVFKNPLLPASEINSRPIFQEDLNRVLEQTFQQYVQSILVSYKDILGKVPGSESLPIVLTGGGSQMKGFRELFEKALPGHTFVNYVPEVVGARSARFMNLIGLVHAGSHYTGSLSDNYKNLPSVSRSSKKETKGKKVSSNPEEDVL